MAARAPRLRNPWAGLRGLPADVWIVFATTLVNRAGMMALPFLVLYVSKYLGVDASVGGMALSAYGLGTVATAPVSGRLCDRIGAFTVMQASLALTGIVLLLVPLVHSFALVVVLTFCWAFVADAGRPATLSAITTITPPDQRKAAIALNRLAVNLGMSIGPAVGGFIALLSFPLLFVVNGATSLAAALLLAMLLRRRARRGVRHVEVDDGAAAPANTATPGAGVLRDPAALVFFAGCFLTTMVFMQYQGAFSLYVVRDLHFKESFYGALFMLNTLVIVAMEVPLNLAMAHWPIRRSLMLGGLLTAAGFGATGLATSAFPLALTVIVWTFGEMILFPSATAYVAELAPAGQNGAYMGAFSAVFGMGMIVGPWLGVAVLDHYGPAVTWSSAFLCGALSLVAFRRARGGQAEIVPAAWSQDS